MRLRPQIGIEIVRKFVRSGPGFGVVHIDAAEELRQRRQRRVLPDEEIVPQRTAARVYWLVEEKAVEGRDYELEKIMPFWQLTSEQDWVICERQQRGVNSSAYVPGPYSTYKEYNVDSFVQWYLEMLTRDAGPAKAKGA